MTMAADGTYPDGRAPSGSSEASYSGGGGGGEGGSYQNLLMLGVGSIWWIVIAIGLGSAANLLLMGVG